MRFLFFAAQYLPTVGGVERYTNNLAKTLVAGGHSATVVTSALPGLPETETCPDGIEVVRLPARQLLSGRFPLLKKDAQFRRLATQLWAKPYDIAIINTRFYPLSLWAAAQCRRRGLPALVLEHGTKHLSLDNALLNTAGNAYEHAVMRRVRHHCEDFYGVSRASAEWLRHFKVEAKGVLYNAVDADAIRCAVEGSSRDFRAELDIPADAPVILFIGRFIVEKGVNELLAAFALLRQRMPDARLVMVGEGPLYPQLAAAQPPGVHLLGNLPHDACVALMAQSDIFCLPTYSEGFSTTILEAAAVGAFIITTPTGGSPELIVNGESGILLDSIEPARLAQVLEQSLADPDFCIIAGEAVRQEVCNRFTWQATAHKLLQVTDALPAGNSDL